MLFSVEHDRTHSITTAFGLMPTVAERTGDFSGLADPIRDPLTGQPFSGGIIPAARLSPQAEYLTRYFPLPNAVNSSGFRGANYQAPALTAVSRDAVHFALSSQPGRRSTLAEAISFQDNVTRSTSLLGFEDINRQATVSGNASWQRRLRTRASARLHYEFSWAALTLLPHFANRSNVSGDAGLTGNSQTSSDWGPPTLSFPDVTSLTDAAYQRSRSFGHQVGGEFAVSHGRHEITTGGDVHLTSLSVTEQADPRGTLAFTGASTGNAFADFLLGLPAASTVGFGNPDTRLAGRAYDGYAKDEWRLAGLTLNLGVRWEYEAPMTDGAGLLHNAVRPDRSGVEPRLGASWRPLATSSFVIRGSYGLYRNLGVYQPLATLLLEQPPFARTFSLTSTPAAPLTLAAPFPESVPSSKTFVVGPSFRSGTVQNWQLSLQRDLPGSVTVVASYLGSRGRHLMQASVPNSSPPGAQSPCATCESGFVLLSSGGTSLRNALQLTLRRRLQAGLTASGEYTLSKSTDDAATFTNTAMTPTSLTIAQNWLDLAAERGPSSFDQRHLLTGQVQYTTGVGVGGGTLIDGLAGTLFKDWTVTAQVWAGSGLPFTPVSFLAATGAGFVGIRPSLTGVPLLPAAAGAYVNPAAFAAPASGAWGTAGRGSIRGPAQFSLDASVARVFRLKGRTSLEWRAAATNLLNRVTFAAIDTVVGSPEFGRPTVANPMRRVQITLRYRF